MQWSKLKLLLAEKGIKTSDLANEMGIKSPTLTRKIQGKINFNTNDIEIILRKLNMSYDEVFTKDISIINVDGVQYAVSKTIASEVICYIKSKEVS